MSKKEIQLSEVEWSLMKICWRRGKTTAREIYEETLKEKERGYQTIKTMLDLVERICDVKSSVPSASGPSSAVQRMTTNQKLCLVLDDNFSPLVAYFSKKSECGDRAAVP